MNKKINFSFNLALVASLLFILGACGPNSDDYDYPQDLKAELTAASTSLTVKQGETISIPVTLDFALSEPANFMLEVRNGEAGDRDKSIEELGFTAGEGFIPGDWGSDYPAFEVVIPAYTTQFDIQLTALEDITSIGTKTLNLKLIEAGLRTAITKKGGIDMTLDIVPGDNFIAQLQWNAIYTDADGDTHEFCSWDIDLELYDGAGASVLDASYSSCPEQLSYAPGDVPNGNYLIVPEYYSNNGEPLPVDFDAVPASITFSKPGLATTTVDLSPFWNDLENGGIAEGNADGDAYQIFELSVTNNVFTVSRNGNVIFEQ